MRNPSFVRAVIVALVMAAAAPLLSACNTVEGAGQDVSAGGHAVTRGAAEVKQGL